jgi:uncharacterized protein YqkB
MGKGCSFGWPVYSVFDEVKPFDGEIETGFIILILKTFFHSRVQDGMMQI